MKKIAFLICMIGAALASSMAGTVVDSNIAASEHWTKEGSPYHLVGVVYVEPGATLTIDAGVVVATFVKDDGSLAITRGAKFYVNGTQDEPVIFTSAEDVATWKGSVVTNNGPNGTVDSITTLGDPKTGTWRPVCNEWGSIAIMGQALISGSHYKGAQQSYQDGYSAPVVENSKFPDGLTKKQMEGLDADAPGDPKVLYGGDDDNDDSGSISYLSLRYGGKQGSDINKELNGLSLGGVGRGTTIDHVEIMNNVDDGIEIWGGTVELEYVNIWNIGDDSFDIDEGWRGKARYGLIVQGYSNDESQGSGIGDNCIEHDGAEDSDAQPVTTGVISNFTCIGQPAAGDGGTAWRDNCRMQYDSCVWMNIGEELVRFDGDDGDGAQGYGYNGTLTWEQTWATSASQTSSVNAISPVPAPGSFNHPDVLYTAQDPAGKLAQIKNSVFFANAVDEDDQADAVGVYDPANNNVTAAVPPIKNIVRGAPVVAGGKTMLPVEYIDPCASGDAAAKGAGAFKANENWIVGWTAADAFGFVDSSSVKRTDVNRDGEVDLLDLADMSADWLM
ncbi:hypothetical protein SMSP2_00919 [Limihaloglobus sulfuriphilus]|uniref:Pectate lyase C n=1 Tax=Limihaloglobus sulfuriphilus TaxID=1851148 RepID=A0A1Q2ME32_9BACT|nr:hypothetical protein [Limihaloglobus sulfuriphilus]AQQ70567.1 hypothetical protein SMSP2_00919 [Limihaloglobus sulfuriphilus]